MFDSLRLHGLQHTRLPCHLPSPRVCLNSCPRKKWCHPTILSSVAPFSFCAQTFPASVSFPVIQFFTSGDQSTRVSALASFLPKNTQGWSPSQLTGLISLQSKGLSRVFSNTTVRILNSSVLSLLYGLALTSIHDYWKNHSFDYPDLCQQSNVSAF